MPKHSRTPTQESIHPQNSQSHILHSFTSIPKSTQPDHPLSPPTQKFKLNNEITCCSCTRFATCCRRSQTCECRALNITCTNCTPNNHCQNRLSTTLTTNPSKTPPIENLNTNTSSFAKPTTSINNHPPKQNPTKTTIQILNPYTKPTTTTYHDFNNTPPPLFKPPPTFTSRNNTKQNQTPQLHPTTTFNQINNHIQQNQTTTQQQQQNNTQTTQPNNVPPSNQTQPIHHLTQMEFELQFNNNFNDINPFPHLDLESSIDLQTQEINLVDKKLIDIYNDTIHQNDGTYIHNDIEDDNTWQEYWKQIISQHHQLYMPPQGKIGATFINQRT